MISRNANQNFATEHWDKLVALGGLAVLAAVAVWKYVLVEEEDPAASMDLPAPVAQAKPVDMKAFNLTERFAKEPSAIAEVSSEKGSFLASELRVFCSAADGSGGCGRPIPYGVEKCIWPDCGIAQKIEEKPSDDIDSDGLPDDWEKKFALVIGDDDSAADPDGDGFTNIEEFTAGTDPKDPKSHPDYLDSLKVLAELKQTYTTIMFQDVQPLPNGGIKYTFKDNDPKRKNDYDHGIYRVSEGEELGKSGFVVKSYEEKYEEKVMGGGMKKKIDVSVATLERKSDGKSVKLQKGVKKTATDVQATLVYERGGAKQFAVIPGDEIDLNGVKYRILDVSKTAKGASVTVENPATKAKRKIEALEQ
jgi:hypothetical protein